MAIGDDASRMYLAASTGGMSEAANWISGGSLFGSKKRRGGPVHEQRMPYEKNLDALRDIEWETPRLADLDRRLLGNVIESQIAGMSAGDEGIADYFQAQRNMAARAREFTGTTMADILGSPEFDAAQEYRRGLAQTSGTAQSAVVQDELSRGFMIDANSMLQRRIGFGQGLAGSVNFAGPGVQNTVAGPGQSYQQKLGIATAPDPMEGLRMQLAFQKRQTEQANKQALYGGLGQMVGMGIGGLTGNPGLFLSGAA